MQTILTNILCILLILAVLIVILSAVRTYFPYNKIPYKLVRRSELLYAKIKLGNTKALFLIDTGAEISFISETLANKLSVPKHAIQHQEVISVQGLTNEIFFPVDKYVELNINMSKLYIFRHTLFVTSLPIDGVLGMDWLSKNKIDFCIKKNKLYIPKQIIRQYDLRCNKSTRTV